MPLDRFKDVAHLAARHRKTIEPVGDLAIEPVGVLDFLPPRGLEAAPASLISYALKRLV